MQLVLIIITNLSLKFTRNINVVKSETINKTILFKFELRVMHKLFDIIKTMTQQIVFEFVLNFFE